MTPEQIIKLLDLKPLPLEGGWYRETYRSDGKIPGTSKNFSTAIYYLLTSDTFSAMHRLPADEIFHFYIGDPVTMLLLHPDGSSEIITLGSDIANGQHVQFAVPAGTWQGSILQDGGVFALMGTTVAPGFDFDDYEAGEGEFLSQKYSDVREWINRLTPDA